MENSINLPFTITKWAAKIWGGFNLAFILFMVFGHIFGPDKQHFNAPMDYIVMTFFPAIVLIGLAVAMKWEKIGGLIGTLGMTVFFILAPGALSSPWFLEIFGACLLLLGYGFWKGWGGGETR